MWCLYTILFALKGLKKKKKKPCKQKDVACPFYLVYKAAGASVEERVPAEMLDLHSDGPRLNQPARHTHLQMTLGPSAHVCSRPGGTQRIILRTIAGAEHHHTFCACDLYTVHLHPHTCWRPAVCRLALRSVADSWFSPTPHHTGCLCYLGCIPLALALRAEPPVASEDCKASDHPCIVSSGFRWSGSCGKPTWKPPEWILPLRIHVGVWQNQYSIVK